MKPSERKGGPGAPGADEAPGPPAPAVRGVRADAQRNIDALLEAAKAVFAVSGVDAPVREIAARAHVGVGTVYRHFPLRSDLIKAVFRREVDACADVAAELTARYEPGEALTNWLLRYAGFIATKRGLAAALHSGDAAYDSLPDYFLQRLEPTLRGLLESAAAAGKVRADLAPRELLYAVANLCRPADKDGADPSQRMVALLIDGMRFGAGAPECKAGSTRRREGAGERPGPPAASASRLRK
ncbi:MAG: helix-turn-helix domain-containing protein [Cystobacter sp.]